MKHQDMEFYVHSLNVLCICVKLNKKIISCFLSDNCVWFLGGTLKGGNIESFTVSIEVHAYHSLQFGSFEKVQMPSTHLHGS